MADKEIDHLLVFCRKEGCPEKDLPKDCSLSFMYDRVSCGGGCYTYCEKVAYYTDDSEYVLEEAGPMPVYEEPEPDPLPEDPPVEPPPWSQEAEGKAPDIDLDVELPPELIDTSADAPPIQ